MSDDTIVRTVQDCGAAGVVGPHDLSFQYRGHDIRFRLTPPGDYVSDCMRRSGFFFDGQRLLGELRYIPYGASVVDVGAHIGTTAVWYSRVCGAKRVVAIEPDSENYSLLVENIRLNNISGVVTPVNVAVGPLSGHSSCIRRSECNTGGTAYRRSDSGSVNMVTLDDLVGRNVVTSADVMKIDVEGYECSVLDGASLFFSRFSPVLIVEVWSPDDKNVDPALCNPAANLDMFLSKTKDLGYRVIDRFGDDYVLARN